MTITKREPRHKLALDTARYEALRRANVQALTTFQKPTDGRDNPLFVRVYVREFVSTYGQVVHGN